MKIYIKLLSRMIVFDIVQQVCNVSNFRTKMNLLILNKYINNNLRIYTFYDILVCKISRVDNRNNIMEYPVISQKLTPIILQRFKYLRVLNLSWNNNISNDDIKHLNLHTLHVSNNYKLRNTSWRHISNNETITDEGIKHMQLHTLNVSGNPRITDEGIKHMKLHTLFASHDSGISNNGIKSMKLRVLDASENFNIGDDGIKNMNLHTLYAYNNETITDK